MIWTKEKIENRQAYIKKLIGTIRIHDSGGEVVRLRQELDLLDALSTAESRNAEREAALIATTWKRATREAAATCQLGVTWTKNHHAILALPCPSPSAIEEEMGETEKKL